MTAPGHLSTYLMPIRRPVTTAMLFLTLVVFGWKSYQELPINLMPDISYPTLTVRTEYEGAAPEDVEKLLTRPLEETLSIVSGMKEIRSISSPGVSEVVMEFTWDTDMRVAQTDVRDRLDLFEPPLEITEKPVILRFDPTLDPVLRVGVTPSEKASRDADWTREELTAIREAVERHVKSDLESEAGVAQVQAKGGQEEEIQIHVDAERLKNLGLSLADVVGSLAQQNINLSGGSLKEGRTEYLVRTLNEFQDVREIGRTVVVNAAGGQVRLEDVADVRMGVKDRDTVVRINGQEAVELELFKEGDANTVEVCNRLKDLLGFERPLSVTERVLKYFAPQPASAQGREEHPDTGPSRAIRDHLPEGVRFTLISDQSRFIIAAIKDVQDSAIQGGFLALLVLYLFLRELKSTLAIGVAIPISVVTVFIPMYLQDISLNIMSLGGLALGIGMLVDNSVVVLESIYRCREEGDGTLEGAERGTREVAAAVISATLTTVAVFFPIAFVEGIAGQIFADQALTVTFSVLASLLVALFLNPMLASRQALALDHGGGAIWLIRAHRDSRGEGAVGVRPLLARGLDEARGWVKQTAVHTFGPLIRAYRGDRPRSLLARFLTALLAPFLAVLFLFEILLKVGAVVLSTVLYGAVVLVLGVLWIVGRILKAILWIPLTLFNSGFNAFREFYGGALARSLRFSPILLAAVALVAGHAGLVSAGLGRELIPTLKQGEFGMRMEAPPGTRLEATEARASIIEQIATEMPEIETVTVQVGMEKTEASGNRGENVAEFTVRLRDPEKNVERQDEIIAALRQRIAARTPDPVTFTLPTMFSFKTAVELQIRGDDPGELRRVGERAVAAIRDVKGLKDPELSVKAGYPEVIVRFDRDLLAARGIAPEQVAQRLRTAVQGDVATRFDQEGEKIDIRVRADRTTLATLQDLREMSVVEGAVPLPLSAVAAIDVVEGPSEIRRVDQRQVVVVSGNVQGRDLGAVSRDILSRVAAIEKPADYSFVLAGQNRELTDSYNSLVLALLMAAFLVYVVMACQFENLGHPALIMFTVPLGFIGVVYALWYTETPVSIVVFIGGIILAGIVVDNAIVLVDYVNQLRARGLSKANAVVEASKVRLRPILMTTLTTVLGLVPMAFARGEGAEMRQPLAITIMAGLLSSTLLTLFIIPMLYYLFTAREERPAE